METKLKMIDSKEDLLAKIGELEIRLEEAEQLIDAIKAGEVDAFAVNKDDQSEIFTLQSGDYAYRILIENFREGALNLSEDGLIVYTNGYFHELLGLSYEAVIGKPVFSFIDPAFKEPFIDLFKKGLAGQSKGEISLLAGDRVIPVYISLTSLYPNLPTVGMIITDLSEKKQQEKEMEEKNKFIETIIESSHELIAVYDTEYTLISMNRACEFYVGIPREKLVGKKLHEIYGGAEGSKAETDLKRALSGEFVENEPFQSPVTGRYIQNYITPLRDKEEKVYAALVIAHDVTAVKNAEQELSRSQKHFSQLFSVSPVAMSLSHANDGMVVDVNQAWEKLFDINRNDAIGKNASELKLTDLDERKENAKKALEAGSNVHGMELKFNLPDGKTVYTYLSIESIELDGISCFLVAYFDLSERIKAEEAIRSINHQLEEKNQELAKSNTELASFSYIASHDLQEPLRKIQTFATRIIEKEQDSLSDNGRMMFGRMQLAAKRMRTLIDDLLAYSRTNTGDQQLERTDLNRIVEDVRNELKEELKEKNALLETSEMCEANILPFQFRQLLHNLIGNSLKFSIPGQQPVIRISSRTVMGSALPDQQLQRDKEYCHISVCDNGIGFESKYNEKIFELFQRLHGKEEFSGTGIGLSIVKRIVENHHGIITARGELNKGTCFDIFIPAL